MRELRHPLLRTALIAVLAAAVVFSLQDLYGLFTAVRPTPLPAWALVSQHVVALTAAALAVVLVLKAFGGRDTRALAAHLAFLSLGYATIARASTSDSILHDSVFAFSGAFAVTAFIHFTRLFPARLAVDDVLGPPGRAWRALRSLQARLVERPSRLWWAGGVYGALWLTYQIGSPAAACCPAVRRGAFLSLLILFVLGILFGLSLLRLGYRKAEPDDRRKILWVVQGYFLAFLVIVAFVTTLGLSYLTGSRSLGILAFHLWFGGYSAAVLAVLVCFAIAIFHAGAFDPSLTLRRTALYSTVVLILTFVFAGVESIVSSATIERLGLPEAADTWVGGGVAALLFGPIRDRLDRFLKPYFTET